MDDFSLAGGGGGGAGLASAFFIDVIKLSGITFGKLLPLALLLTKNKAIENSNLVKRPVF